MSTDTKLVAIGGSDATIPLDTDTTLTANSDKRVATQKAVKAAIAAALSDATPTELDLLDGALAGTVVVSKAAVYDSAGKLYRSSASPAAAGSSVTDATALTAEFNYVTGANGSLGVVLPVAAANEVVTVVNSVTTAGNYLKVYAITGSQINALGSTVAFQLNPGQIATFIGRSATLWNTAAASDTISGLTATAAELNYNDIAALGTGAASKAVVLDAGDDYVWPATGVFTYGVLKDPAATTIVATGAEINRACDVSTRVVSLTGTAAITEILHEGKIGVITGTGAAYTYTLPEATGSGATYRFIMNQVNTSNTIFTTADAGNCGFYGSVNILDKDAAAQAAYAPAATDEIMTLNGTTTGGAIGDFIQFVDMATDKWCVFAQLQCPTGSNPATPFSGA
jgi:hypothetical protein